MSMFRIKICGVTRPDDAAAIAESGADAIGVNFYPPSPRFVSDERAAEVLAALPQGVAKVGVFVNAGALEIRDKVQRLGLDYVQLHGDEPPQIIALLAGIPVIRTLRLRPGDTAPKILPASGEASRLPIALLVDAAAPGAYGGTGQTVDWTVVPLLRRQSVGLPIILAGGLTPENVAEAINISGADCVDTASGVESSLGVKDWNKVRAFVASARTALAFL